MDNITDSSLDIVKNLDKIDLCRLKTDSVEKYCLAQSKLTFCAIHLASDSI